MHPKTSNAPAEFSPMQWKLNMSEPSNRIAFQGEPGANSEIACRDMYPGMEPMPCPAFEDAFNAVESGAARLAMIPIENTIAGRVADIHHLLPESDLHIIAEYFLPIRFHLMVLPGTKFEDIRSVHTHVHALGQCRNIIRENKWQGVVAGDTAGGARQVSQQTDRSRAAIAPELAAELYNLEIIRRDIADVENNITRFVVLSNTPELPARTPDKKMMTTFVFRVRNIPAALFKAMGGFATNGVNMTKLESYQLGGTFFATQFYADIEGHPDDPNVKLAFEEAGFFSDHVRILGVYPADKFRAKM
jgi:prephenate dehydratase